MTFKNDQNLQTLMVAAQHAGISDAKIPYQHGRELYDDLVESGFFENTTDNVGFDVQTVIGKRSVKDVCDFLSCFYGLPIKCNIVDAFCHLQIVSEGCPECGGKLELIETDGHELHDGDYWTPNTYIVDEYIYRCAECGETIKTENEL